MTKFWKGDGAVMMEPQDKYREVESALEKFWGEEVCGQLRISPRTLQTLRDRRLIGYSQINRRFYYKPEEVKRLIPLIGTLYPGAR